MKVIVFGTGVLYEKYKYLLNNDDIIAYLDNSINKQGMFFDNKAPIIPPDCVHNYEYDRIYLASVKAKEMFYQLIELGVSPIKIYDICDALNLDYEAGMYRNCESAKDTVYVFCPLAVTGGPEALHQLADSIYRNTNKVVYIVYTDNDADKERIVREAYGSYQCSGFLHVNQVPDKENSIIVVPESASEYVEIYKRAKIFFWWLSVDNFFWHRPDNMVSSIQLMNHITVHMCQSKYAINYLKSCNIPKYKIFEVSDYTTSVKVQKNIKRENIVLYNPTKSFYYTYGLIQAMKTLDANFIALENLSREQVAKLMCKAKVYIDMGRHPGKDRMPREAALNGCCVITGIRGSAANNYDVSIPNKYKVNQESGGYAKVIELIKKCIDNYDEVICDFDNYTENIRNEKYLFDDQIMALFADN